MIPAWAPALLAVVVILVPAGSARTRLAGCRGSPRDVEQRSTGRARARDRLGPGSPQRLRVLVRRWRESDGDSGSSVLLLSFGAAALAGVALIAVSGWFVALAGAAVTGPVAHRVLRTRSTGRASDPLHVAAGWDLLAAGLRAGLPVPVAVRAVAAELTGSAAASLLQVADQLVLGADPVSAWEPALRDPDTAELARAARRTARTGSGLAGVADDIATRHRSSIGQRAQARAQRAAVWVAAPLGLCFLPAFLCLGVLPVVVGMVEQMRSSW